MMEALVIGGGLGGLSCAAVLAGGGYRVTVLEKEDRPGGKLRRIRADGYTFDMGPSTITMLDAFEEVFRKTGRNLHDYIDVYPVDPLTRNFFPDGHQADLSPDAAVMEKQIERYSPGDAENYRAFMAESAAMYRISSEQFLTKLLTGWRDKLNPGLLKGFMQIRPSVSLSRRLRKYFSHPNTLAMFGRYATYVGSSPSRAPSVFQMMAHLEAERGIYGIRGGTYSLVEAFESLGAELGVHIETNTEVSKLLIENGKAAGAVTSKGIYRADTVIANTDALTVYSNYIDRKDRPSMSDRKIEKLEPSLSGFAIAAGVAKTFPQLVHHNVFFPEQYENEFRDLFDRKKAPEQPAVYICFTGYSDSGMAPEGKSNLFILVNAPYLAPGQEWEKTKRQYAEKILSMLEDRGLTGLREATEYLDIQTPEDLARRTGAYRGAIYGLSANSFRQAFFKPGNKAKDIEGLWFTGGSVHPGGGTPIVVRSGRLAAEAILAADKRTRRNSFI